jgi:hypothetical protein
MRKPLLWGIAAGAVGTIALDVVTYLDMIVRPAGQLHAGGGGRRPGRAGRCRTGRRRQRQRVGRHRHSGLGALFGYGVGLGIGAAYGLLRSLVPEPLWPGAAAAGLGLAAMAASDLPATRSG